MHDKILSNCCIQCETAAAVLNLNIRSRRRMSTFSLKKSTFSLKKSTFSRKNRLFHETVDFFMKKSTFSLTILLFHEQNYFFIKQLLFQEKVIFAKMLIMVGPINLQK